MAVMPWCVTCNKFLTPSTVRPDATCPKCGRVVERGLIPGMTRPADEAPPETAAAEPETESAPTEAAPTETATTETATTEGD